MVMSTQTLVEAAGLVTEYVLIDTVQILTVGDPVTVGAEVTRDLTPVGDPIPGLVQTTVLQNAVESIVESTYSVKVPQGTDIKPGQAVRVVTCIAEPSLTGKVLLLGKVSENGVAIHRKATATDFQIVDQQGKGGLS